MAEFMDQHPHHIVGDALLEPVGTEPEFVENQFATRTIRSRSEMMGSGAEFHSDASIENLFGDYLCEGRDLGHSLSPF